MADEDDVLNARIKELEDALWVIINETMFSERSNQIARDALGMVNIKKRLEAGEQ